MKKVVIVTTLTEDQLAYLKNLAEENNISADFFFESIEESEITSTKTPITGQILESVANATNKSVLEIASLANQYGITTVEEALEHENIPSSVKEILESYL